MSQTLISQSPAFNLFERTPDYTGYVNITAADTIGLMVKCKHHGDEYLDTFSPGSVVSYALKYNECPIEAVEHAKRHGHDLHWINADAVVVSAHKRPAKDVVRVTLGMRVRFEGLLATIEKAPHGNLRFAPIAA